jgi:SAM-dependent methyltransferase
MSTSSTPVCRFCGTELVHTFVDLGNTPLANAYLSESALGQQEPHYPLHARVCHNCFLVQVESVVPAEEIFSDYAYFSSYSSSWVEHARRFARTSISRFGLGADSRVVEVASNDGYLLRHFVEAGIPVLGIEPAVNVAKAANAAGVPTEATFFGAATARELRGRGWAADLLVGNNVLAHVPDLNDFVAGLAILLRPSGALSVEFPHLLRLVAEVQFDTIYHEHFSYFSFLTVERVFAAHGLTVFDVEQLPTHGGSLRVFASREDGTARKPSPALERLRAEERSAGLDGLEPYAGFSEQVSRVKAQLLDFLHTAKAEGRAVVAYGAAAKGNTLLNTCGIDRNLIAYVVDRSPHKQGRYLPGSHLFIHAPEHIFTTKPDYVLILPWNLREEIIAAMKHVRDWGGRFVLPSPRLKVVA